MRRGVFALVAFAVASLGGPAAAQRDGFIIDSPRITGMGGAGVAVHGMDNAFFLNPALLAAQTRTQFRILDLRAVANQNTFSQYNFYRDHRDEFNGLDNMTDTERNRFYQDLLGVARDQTVFGFGGVGPFAMIKPGFAIGIFERARVDYDLKEGASAIPLIQADAIAEGSIIVGHGRSIAEFFGRDLAVGGNAKYVYRAVSSESRSAPAVETIDDVELYRGWTIAFDLGALMTFDTWALGLGLYDFNWPEIRWNTNNAIPDGFAPPENTISGNMRAGVSWRPPMEVRGLFEDVQLAFDFDSPFSEDMAFFKKISMGGEALFAGSMRLRLGIHQGYPTVGAMAALGVLKLEYAFGGEALGRHPGQLESWNHVVAVGFGWGY